MYRYVRIPRLVPRLVSAVQIAELHDRRRVCRRCLTPYRSDQHRICQGERMRERQMREIAELARLTRPKSPATVARTMRARQTALQEAQR